MNLSFEFPLWLPVGLLVTILMLGLSIWFERRAQRRLHLFAAPQLLESLTLHRSTARRRIKTSLILLATASLFVTLSRPQWGARWEESTARGIDLLFAVDTSKSMLAMDIAPNRLERARLAILDFLDAVHGDRVGLIAFAGRAFLQCPLTLDYQAVRNSLAALDTQTIPVPGTNIAAAIAEAEAYFASSENVRILILITDGEDLEASGIQRARQAADNGTLIYTIGVGAPEGELIPIQGPDGAITYLTDANGKPVTSRLDEDTLRQIARAANGEFAPLGATGNGLEAVYQHIVARIPAAERAESLQRIPIERFQWPLLLAIFLLAAEPILSSRRRAPKTTGLALLPLAILFPSPAADASPAAAARAFANGDFATALDLYEDAVAANPDAPRLHYNLGLAAYQLGDFDRAVRAFAAALHNARPALQSSAFFNSANARVAAGLADIDALPEQARNAWFAAMREFENALSIDPDAADAAQNRAATEALIAQYTHTLSLQPTDPSLGSIDAPEALFHNIPHPIAATAAEGHQFAEWSLSPPEAGAIDDPKAPDTNLALSAPATLAATFLKTWKLSVAVNDPDMGSAKASGTFPEGQPVPIEATPNDYFAFSHWMLLPNDAATIDNPQAPQTTISLSNNATVTAHFVPAFKLTTDINPAIAGQAGPSGFFEEFSTVDLTAQPRDGFEWSHWSGPVNDPQSPQTQITLTEDRSVTAHCRRIWNLVIVPVPEQGGQTSGAGDHPVGATVPISASPAEGFTFSHWEGPAVVDPKAPQTDVTVASTEHTLFAVFTADESDDQNQDASQQDQQDQQDSQNQNPQQNQNQDPQSEPQEDSHNPSDQQDATEQDQSSSQQGEPPQPEDPSTQDNPSAQQGQEDAQPSQSQSVPMSREAARQLLNALQNAERILPAAPDAPTDDPNAPPAGQGRDW